MKYFLLLNIFLGQFCYAQECDCDILFGRYKKEIQIELARYGRLAGDDETEEAYYTLMLNCPVGALEKYADDSIPAIRCEIFVGLAQKNADNELLAKIFSRYKNDSAYYICGSSDAAVSWRVHDCMEWTLKMKLEKELPKADFDYSYWVKKIRNEPRYLIPGLSHGTVSKDSLLKLDSLSYLRKEIRVVSFSISVSDSINLISPGNIFTSEMKEFIRNTNRGDWIFIDQVIAIDGDNKRRRLPSIQLRIR